MDFDKVMTKLAKLKFKLNKLSWSQMKENILDRISHLEEDIESYTNMDGFTHDIITKYIKDEYTAVYKATKNLIDVEREDAENLKNIE